MSDAPAPRDLPLDAVRQDTRARLRIFASMVLMLVVAGLGVSPFVGHDEVRAWIFRGLLVAVTVIYGLMLHVTRRPIEGRRAEATVGVVAHVTALAATTMQLVFGPFSPAAMVSTVALHAYALGASPAWTISVWLNVAGSHAALAALVMTGTITDHGLVTARGMRFEEQVVVQVCVQVAYAVAVIVGLFSRRQTLASVTELERAVRLAAERGALLAEVRGQLDRAAGLGEPGRFTEHVVADHRLGVVIGRGAMGEVYAATHVTTGAEAAVKLLPLKRLASPEMVARFHREAEIARALSSPHVVRVLDVSPPEAELPYLVMERLHGDDLGHTLREERKLPLRAAVELVQQVAEGLEAARAAGIVHRDLKPSNLFRAGGGGDAPVWKILDFSVSKLAGGGGTITNDQAIGTPGYMAPEQARGLDVDHRADVYGLAAVAYRVLTGHATFAGDDVPSLLYRVVHHMPRRPGELQPMPPEVELVLAIGLAKEPGERFPTARELAAALTAAARGELDAWSRSRARTLLADRPWGSERSLSRRG